MPRGRPKNYPDTGAEVVESSIDSQPESQPSPSVKKLKTKIVGYAEYLKEARDLLRDGPVNGMTDVWNLSIALVYDRHEVIGIVQKAGETRFVVKV